MNKDFFKMKFEGIQLLRFLAALGVAIYHLDFVGKNCSYNMCIGVFLFFSISGFITMYVTEKSTDKFLIKRIVRIIPLYWLVTLGTYILYVILSRVSLDYTVPTISELLKSMFLIPYMRDGYKSTNVIRPIVGPGWTLMYEFLFYYIFWLAIRVSKKYRGIIASIILIVISLVGQFYNGSMVILKFFGGSNLLFFVLGICSYYIVKGIFYKTEFYLEKSKCIGLLFIGLVIVLGIGYTGFFNISTIITVGIPNIVLLIISVIVFSNIKAPSFLVKLGDISFSFYLLHYYILFIASKIFGLTEISSRNVLISIISIIIAWGGHISHGF